jgi:hypothetical protein
MLNTSDAFEIAKAEAMLTGYHFRWSGDADLYEVLAVEAEFFTALVNPTTGAPSRTWRLGGKLDAAVREIATGREGVVEHKTSTEDVTPGSDYWKRLRLDGQVSTYFEGARALGLDPQFCLYDVLATPKLRPYKATPLEARKFTKDGALYKTQREADETPEEYRTRVLNAIAEDPDGYFQRGEVVRLQSEMDEAMFDVWQIGQQMRESERAGRYPRNPDACVRFGKTCQYFGVCTGEASLADPTKFRRSSLHPELASVNGTTAILSSSRLKDARACQRLHRYRYIDCIRPAEEAAVLRFGSLIHLGLEAWWKAPPGERLDAALAAINPQHTPSLAVASAQ